MTRTTWILLLTGLLVGDGAQVLSADRGSVHSVDSGTGAGSGTSPIVSRSGDLVRGPESAHSMRAAQRARTDSAVSARSSAPGKFPQPERTGGVWFGQEAEAVWSSWSAFHAAGVSLVGSSPRGRRSITSRR